MNNNVAQLRADVDPLATLDPVLLGALTAGAHEMVAILDPQQRILWCGGAVEAISGYSPQERIGQLAMHFVHPDDRDYALERTREFIANASAQSRSETMSIRTLHRDGGYRHVEIAGTPQAWAIGRLQSQFDNLQYDNGPHSLPRNVFRYRLYQDAKTGNAVRKRGAIKTLQLMKEKGVLLALREESGETGNLARRALHESINRLPLDIE
jgi:PAS domain S-box-containing protein